MLFGSKLTETAELRSLEPWQAAEFLTHIDEARANIEPFVSFVDVVVDEHGAREFIQRYADRQAADSGRLYGIWLEGKLVGGLLFRTFEVRTGCCEIGAWLSAEAEGRGLIGRAVQQLIDWAIEVRGMNRIEWRCFTTNERSAAVAKRLGMTLEGTLRQDFPYRGEVHDSQVWAMIRDDWEHRPWK